MHIKFTVFTFLISAQPIFGSVWNDFWWNKDQQGMEEFKQGNHQAAADLFESQPWQAAALYRAGQYEKVSEILSDSHTAIDHYNRGNALALTGDYETAIAEYEQAIEQNPPFEDAVFNRDLLKKILDQQEQSSSDQEQSNSDQEQSPENKKDNQKNQSSKNNNSSSNQNNKNSSSNQNQGQDQNKSDQNKESSAQQNSEENESDNSSNQNKENSSKQNSEKNNEHSSSSSNSSQNDSNQPDKQASSSNAKKSDGSEPNQSNQSNSSPRSSENEQKEKENTFESSQNSQSGDNEQVSDRLSDQQQATEQWLKRIPDDPGDLLRQKFLRDHQRYQSGQGNNDE